MLSHFNMANYKPIMTPMEPGLCLSHDQSPRTAEEHNSMHSVDYGGAIGSLQYLSCTTQPDIIFAVGQLTSFTSDPGIAHWNAIKHLFHSIQDSLSFSITYFPDLSSSQLFQTYSDANHGGCKNSGCSTSAYVVKIGTGIVSWMCKLLQKIGFESNGPLTLHMDNQSAIQVAKHPEHHGRMKHLDLHWYWLWDIVDRGIISPHFIPTSDRPADLLTKALPQVKV